MTKSVILRPFPHTCLREVPTKSHEQQRQTENNGAFRQQTAENRGKTQLEHP